MAKRNGKKPELKPSDLSGLRSLAPLRRLLESLHAVGAERDKAGDRSLRMDDYCILLMAWFFNPIVDSLRGVQQMSGPDKVRKRLHVERTSLGALSEAVSVFDPEPLKEIVAELNDRLPTRTPEKFDVVDKKITAVDGSVLRVLTQIAIQAYLAILACLVIMVSTGRQPNKRTFEMICFYFAGWASLDELLTHINKLKACQNEPPAARIFRRWAPACADRTPGSRSTPPSPLPATQPQLG